MRSKTILHSRPHLATSHALNTSRDTSASPLLTLHNKLALGLVSVGFAGIVASVVHPDALEHQLPLPTVLHDLDAVTARREGKKEGRVSE